jgi:hypothetical protein
MHKEFLPYETMRNNSIKLAYRLYRENFIPDVIYVSLRGGAYLGNIVSEYFKIVRKESRPVFYAAVVARSYTDIRRQGAVMVDGWTYNPEYLRHGDKVLLVDDIFDSGKTINKLVELIVDKGIPREDIKIAVHDYKVIEYEKDPQPIRPDYYCRKHIIKKPEDEIWIHYTSHELFGLTAEELEKYYFSTDEELREPLKVLLDDRE